MRTSTTICACLLTTLFACQPRESYGAGALRVDRAVAELVPIADSGVHGTVQFARVDDEVRVTGRITGLAPGLHGFHVHQFGDLSDTKTGASAGGHFAPRGMPHGRRTDQKRHVGDLGNIEADDQGVAVIDFTDGVIKLEGPFSILGRSIVVHAGEDHFTQPSGDAGARVAFGVIGIAKSEAGS